MKGTDVFPSKYLRAADLDGREPIVTIDRVDMETLGDERKPVVYFTGKEKGLVMNKTNWTTLEDITREEDSDQWRGTSVKLVTVKVEFQGKRVPAIRIEELPRNGRASTPAPPRQPDPPMDAPADDDIPFAWLLPFALPLISVGSLL